MLLTTLWLDPEAVALASTLRSNPDIEVEAKRVAAHSTAWTMPCLWVTAQEFDPVDEAIAEDRTVDEVVDATEFAERKYYQVRWVDDVTDRIDTYVDNQGSVLNARATADGWRLRLRFASREQFDDLRAELDERGHSFELVSLTTPDEADHPVVDLPQYQRRALTVARERGYYEVPREVTLRELADDLDTTHQNLSRVLRRATDNLIERAVDPPPSRDA